MLTVTDLDTIFLDAQSVLDEWEQEFQLQFNAPLVQASMVQGLLEISPQAAAAFRQTDPKTFQSLANHIERMRRQ